MKFLSKYAIITFNIAYHRQKTVCLFNIFQMGAGSCLILEERFILMKLIQKAQRSIIFLIKILMFICLFIGFFGPYFPSMAIHLFKFTRVTAVTALTFAVSGLAFIKIYGGFAVGQKKSKEITYSVFLAALITDFITYLQFSIMVKQFLNIGILLLILVIHYLTVFVFARFGNFVYFKINPPEKCAVFYDPETTPLDEYLKKIGKYKKQYKVNEIVDYRNESEYRAVVRRNDSVFLFNIPVREKTELIDYCYKRSKNIYSLPEISDVIINHSQQVMLDDTVLLATTQTELTFEQKIIKRVVDIVLSGIGIIIASPIMLLEAIAIKLEDHGPVLFKQERITKNGKTFKVLKFRTMIVDADKMDQHLARVNDNRITKVGAVLRKLRIDELPQLINIFLGDMSIVGPRPEQLRYVEKFAEMYPEFKYRHRVKAGLTGLAQIAGKYNTSPKDKLMLDLMYIEKYSIWLDFKLMFQTLKVLFKSDSTEGFAQEEKEQEDAAEDGVEFIKHEDTASHQEAE